MHTQQSLTIGVLVCLIAGCTARNTQTDYYGGELTPIPQREFNPAPSGPSNQMLPAPGASNPGTSNSGGPTLLSPEPDLGPAARNRPRLPAQNVRTDPWGRPQTRRPSVRHTIRQKVEHRTLWQSQYQSTERRPIQTVQVGVGDSRVMVLASLRGTDPASITVVDLLANAMSNDADLQNACTALFVRSPNPDGIAKKSPYNARGIDLNRNFPTDDWRRTADGTAGPNGGSEIETRVLIRLIDDFKPDRIIVVENTSTAGSVAYAGPARQLARLMAMQNGYEVSSRATARSGSLEQFVGNDRRLPIVVLAIDRRLEGRIAWAAHADGLKVALRAVEVNPDDPSSEELDPQGPVANSKHKPLPLNINGGDQGANQGRSSNFEAPRPPRRLYYELPPPSYRP